MRSSFVKVKSWVAALLASDKRSSHDLLTFIIVIFWAANVGLQKAFEANQGVYIISCASDM